MEHGGYEWCRQVMRDVCCQGREKYCENGYFMERDRELVDIFNCNWNREIINGRDYDS